MKILKFLMPVFVLATIGLCQEVKAQKSTDVPLFKDMTAPFEGVVVWCKEFNILPVSKKQIKPVSATLLKKMKAPGKVKRIKSPLFLKYKGDCYKISMRKGTCKDCSMFWYDANKDGKINPMRELKCYCAKCKQPCKVVGKKIDCKSTKK